MNAGYKSHDHFEGWIILNVVFLVLITALFDVAVAASVALIAIVMLVFTKVSASH